MVVCSENEKNSVFIAVEKGKFQNKRKNVLKNN